MKTFVDELVAAIKNSDPSEAAVHAALDSLVSPEAVPDNLLEHLALLGSIVAAQYTYVDKHVRIPQHRVRQGDRPDLGGAIKSAAVKTYALKFYKEVIR